MKFDFYEFLIRLRDPKNRQCFDALATETGVSPLGIIANMAVEAGLIEKVENEIHWAGEKQYGFLQRANNCNPSEAYYSELPPVVLEWCGLKKQSIPVQYVDATRIGRITEVNINDLNDVYRYTLPQQASMFEAFYTEMFESR